MANNEVIDFYLLVKFERSRGTREVKSYSFDQRESFFKLVVVVIVTDIFRAGRARNTTTFLMDSVTEWSGLLYRARRYQGSFNLAVGLAIPADRNYTLLQHRIVASTQ